LAGIGALQGETGALSILFRRFLEASAFADAGNKTAGTGVSDSGMLVEDEMSYDPTLRVPSTGRDVAGLILWVLLVAGLCLIAPPSAALRMVTLAPVVSCPHPAGPIGS
jgi:hypothetical protein